MPIPNPIPILDTEAFRRKLAGLEDPLARSAVPGAAHRGHLKEVASRLCSVLAKLYDVDDKDRTALWQHIGKALEVADEKTTDDDVEHFVNECLSIVKADPAQSAAGDALTALLSEMAGWPAEVRHDWLNYLRSHRYPVLTFGRMRWELVKKGEVEL